MDTMKVKLVVPLLQCGNFPVLVGPGNCSLVDCDTGKALPVRDVRVYLPMDGPATVNAEFLLNGIEVVGDDAL